MTTLNRLNVGEAVHCGACGRPLIRAGAVWMHVLDGWDQDYIPHDAEPVASRD